MLQEKEDEAKQERVGGDAHTRTHTHTEGKRYRHVVVAGRGAETIVESTVGCGVCIYVCVYVCVCGYACKLIH
jgi:hypothetical protein